jgi:hypothetical protein
MAIELNTLAPKKWVGNYGGVVPTLDVSDDIRVGDYAIDSSVTGVLPIWQCRDNTEGDLLRYTGVDWANVPEPFQVKHGFENRTDSSFEIVGGYYQISPTTTSYTFWVNGVKFVETTLQEVEITDNLKQTYVYFDNTGTLQKATSVWDINDLSVIPVAIVYKDGSIYFPGDERHGSMRALPWHKWAHKTIGARYDSGFTGTFTDTTLSVEQGVLSDEDLDFDSGGTLTSCSIWYRNATVTAMRVELASSTPFRVSVGGIIQYDAAGTLTEADNNKYVNNWVYADNNYGISVVVGQAQYNTLAQARSASFPSFPGFTTLEWKLLYRITYQRSGTSEVYIENADYRNVSNGPAASSTPTSHASLTARDQDNAHPASAISHTPLAKSATTSTDDVAGALTVLELNGPRIEPSIDGKSVADTDIWICPTSYKASVFALLLKTEAVTAITVLPTIALSRVTPGVFPAPDVTAVIFTGVVPDDDLKVTGGVQRFLFQSDEFAAGDILRFSISSAATGTSLTLKAVSSQDVYP